MKPASVVPALWPLHDASGVEWMQQRHARLIDLDARSNRPAAAVA
jgi:hypothetical protein